MYRTTSCAQRVPNRPSYKQQRTKRPANEDDPKRYIHKLEGKRDKDAQQKEIRKGAGKKIGFEDKR